MSEYQNDIDTNGLSPQPQEPDQAGLDEHNDSKSQVLNQVFFFNLFRTFADSL